MSKSALVRFKNRGQFEHLKNGKPNLKFRKPMRVDHVIDVGEGSNFVHIFCTPNEAVPIHEVNIHSADIDSITIIENFDEPQPGPSLVDPNGLPLSSGDEVQADERLPVTQETAGASPVVPAIVEA